MYSDGVYEFCSLIGHLRTMQENLKGIFSGTHRHGRESRIRFRNKSLFKALYFVRKWIAYMKDLDTPVSRIKIQSNLIISNSLISNYRLSRSENLVPVLT